MTTIRKERQKKILDLLSEQLPVYGLTGKMVKGSIPQPIECGTAFVHFGFIERGGKFTDYFEIISSITIRHEKLETMVCDIAQVKAKTSTIAANVGYLDTGKYKTWSVENDSDIPLQANKVLECYGRCGPGFIEKFSKETAIYEILTSQDVGALYYSPILHERARRALALAFLMGKTEELPLILKQQKEVMVRAKDLSFGLLQDFVTAFSVKYGVVLES